MKPQCRTGDLRSANAVTNVNVKRADSAIRRSTLVLAAQQEVTERSGSGEVAERVEPPLSAHQLYDDWRGFRRAIWGVLAAGAASAIRLGTSRSTRGV